VETISPKAVSIQTLRYKFYPRFALLLVLSGTPTLAAQKGEPLDCFAPNSQKLSQQKVKSLLVTTESIQPPALGHTVHIETTAVLAIRVDDAGTVTCAKAISGHPLIISSVIESVSHWKFRPYFPRGKPRSFYGRIAILIHVNEQDVKYYVIGAHRN
jgi:hypothetical protein